MTNDGGAGRDMRKTWEGRRRAAARERLRRAAETLATVPDALLSPYSQEIVARAGKRALDTIDQEGGATPR
jgi:hypothetical protein